MIQILFLAALLGYLLGSLSFAVIIGKVFYKKDVRESGSKSAGATNTLRTLGKKAAILVTLGDLVKGILAFLLGSLIGSYWGFEAACGPVAGLFAVLGHNYPVYFHFRGGKGVLTSLAVSFMIDYRAALIVLVFAILVMAFTKYVSLGSILGCLLNAVLIFFFQKGNTIGITVIVLLAVLAVVKHHANIQRLIRGEEHKLGQKSNT